MSIPVDYDVLRVIWWALMGVLLIGFALTDGFDLGVATLLPWVAKNDEERRMVINTVAPTWEGNQVWLILGGGAIFAAWPFVYAVSFSGFYLAMFLVLSALILRPVGFKYRSKREGRQWRSRWDWALFVGGLVPALVFGVAVGNVLIGAPFRFDSDLRLHYEGGLLGLFTPFTLIAGLLSVAMLTLHGAGWLSLKVEKGPVLERAQRFGKVAAILVILLYAAGLAMLLFGNMGYRISSAAAPTGPSNPLDTTALHSAGGWLSNYASHRWMRAAPIIGFVGPIVAYLGIARRNQPLVFAGSSLAIAGIIASVGASMFPFILPSSIDAHSSLTVWNASSSHTTLWIMLLVTLVFLPIVLAYTSWAFKVMFGRVSLGDVRANPDFY
jgi:cytochrome bd ubiquinol oxidase subunit II